MIQSVETEKSTKNRILDAAESLFAEYGIASTSLRQITTAADVNLAAVNYHFRSKESLVEAVLLRKLEPINRRRMELLDQMEAARGGWPIPIEDLVRGFMQPIFELRLGGENVKHFPLFMSRLYMEPGNWMARVMFPNVREPLERYLAAMQRSLGVQRRDLLWGVHLGIGSMVHILLNSPLLNALLGSDAATETIIAESQERLVQFMSAGIRAMERKEK
jgi:AcrR family transcriptional regulator